jgi:hypothetical protein
MFVMKAQNRTVPFIYSDSTIAKPKLQNVKYDAATGKMYEELGSTLTTTTSSSGVMPMQQQSSSQRSTLAASDYMSYGNQSGSYQMYSPYSQMSHMPYMPTGFASNYAHSPAHQINPYDR